MDHGKEVTLLKPITSRFVVMMILYYVSNNLKQKITTTSKNEESEFAKLLIKLRLGFVSKVVHKLWVSLSRGRFQLTDDGDCRKLRLAQK